MVKTKIFSSTKNKPPKAEQMQSKKSEQTELKNLSKCGN